MKKFTKKLFLFLCVIALIFGISACDSPEKGIENSQYLKTQFSEFDIEGEYDIVENIDQLKLILTESIPVKYDEEFFTANSLVLVKLMKNAQGEKDVIESYAVSESVLQINLKTVEHKSRAANEHWYCILEVAKAEITEVSTVKVMRAGVEISETYNYSLNFDNTDEKWFFNPESVNIDPNLDTISITFKKCKIGCYPEFDLKYINIPEATSFKYISGPMPPEYYFLPEYRNYLLKFRQSVIVYITPQESEEKLLEIVRRIEKFDFVKYAGPDTLWDYTSIQ